MHPILASHVKELKDEYEFENHEESKIFEFFCNYCVLSKSYYGRFDPVDITTNEDDAAIDGLAVTIDGDLILTEGDAEQAFQTHKKNLIVDFIAVQAKSGEKFTKEDISNYSMGLEDFLSLTPKLPNGEYNREIIKILEVVFDNLKKVANNRPNALVYYCTSGNYTAEAEIKAAFEIMKSSINDTDLFYSVSIFPFGRRELLTTWKTLNETNEARVKLIDFCGIPQSKDIPQSYLAIVNCKTFVESLLLDDDRRLKQGVFDENVRAFLGNNTVNSNIISTLQNESKRHLFSVLNNGITVVAPQLTLTANSKEMDLVNYQIINGCQTSNMLYKELEHLSDDVNVVVRFIESPDNDVSADIISATNSQTSIEHMRFQGLKDKAKLVQHYFTAQNSKHNSNRNQIYFERREKEYREHDYYATQIFDVKELGRAYASGVLNEPHTASRYVTKLFENLEGKLFKEDDAEALYYMCAFILYKFNTLTNGKKINAPSYKKYKWHLIQLFMWVTHGKVSKIQPNANNASKYAEKVIKTLASSDRKYTNIFKKCFEIIDLFELAPTTDQLKRSRFTNDLREKADEYLKAKV